MDLTRSHEFVTEWGGTPLSVAITRRTATLPASALITVWLPERGVPISVAVRGPSPGRGPFVGLWTSEGFPCGVDMHRDGPTSVVVRTHSPVDTVALSNAVEYASTFADALPGPLEVDA